MEQKLNNKKTTAQEVQAQEQLKVKNKVQVSLNELLKGKSSINETRLKFGLLPLKDELANAKITKV